MNYEQVAASLYDGGWRAEDAEELQNEYKFTDEEMSCILKDLERFEQETN